MTDVQPACTFSRKVAFLFSTLPWILEGLSAKGNLSSFPLTSFMCLAPVVGQNSQNVFIEAINDLQCTYCL